MDYAVLFIYGALIGLIPATVAYQKGYSFIVWWLFGGLLFIVALPMAIVLKPDVAELEKRQLKQGTMKRCPHCAELVKREARVCKHCGRDMTVPPQPNNDPNLGHPEVAMQPKLNRGGAIEKIANTEPSRVGNEVAIEKTATAEPPAVATEAVIEKTAKARPSTVGEERPRRRVPKGSPMITDVDKLITFGQMAVEQGWYDQARDHFEQALALDPSNCEAMKGLARVYERLSHRGVGDD